MPIGMLTVLLTDVKMKPIKEWWKQFNTNPQNEDGKKDTMLQNEDDKKTKLRPKIWDNSTWM